MRYLRRAIFPIILFVLTVALAGCGGGGAGGNAPRGSINTPPSNLTYTVLNPTYIVGSDNIVGTTSTQNKASSSGGTIATYNVFPPLPSGLTLNPDGSISGIPSSTNTPNTAYTVTALNDAGNTSVTLYITVKGTVGGQLVGLSGSGLMLSNDSNGDILNVSSSNSGIFTFPTPLNSGDKYSVSVSKQPSNPAQYCTVGSGSGALSATNITNIVVTCNTTTVGGTVTGLVGSGLTLQLQLISGSTLLNVSSNGKFTFPSDLTNGETYTVAVNAQPSKPGQQCIVSNDTGTIVNGASVNNVNVNCSIDWTWEDGTSKLGDLGSYPANYGGSGTPQSRDGAAGWTNTASGQLWLFGGFSGCGCGTLNDLWRYTPGSGWTWEAGENPTGLTVVSVAGTYTGTTLSPGSRMGVTSWIDGSGNLWMFGGNGLAATTTTTGYLNDLWMYNPVAKSWSWKAGLSTVNMYGIYDAIGYAGTVGARNNATGWIDKNTGNLWLFGGFGNDDNGAVRQNLNDLWMYDTSLNNWYWEGGSTKGEAATVYTSVNGSIVFPGARSGATGWTDAKGNFWLFGGEGVDASKTVGYLNELWMFNPNNNSWTFEGGAKTLNDTGNYVSVGSVGMPHARKGATGWTDANGHLWLYGGYYSDSNGTAGQLDDLWMYDPGSNTWTWEGGTQSFNSAVNFPNSPSGSGNPGSRNGATAWAIPNGKLWLFGGDGFVTGNPNGARLNDLWSFKP